MRLASILEPAFALSQGRFGSTAFRVDVREKSRNLAEITNPDGVANLFDAVRRQQATGLKRSPIPPVSFSPAAPTHWHPAIQIPMYARTS
jgi:hypothetical protein